MMRKTLLVCLSFLLIAAVLSGCAQVTQKLDQFFPEKSEETSVTADPNIIPMPERERRTYVILLASRAQSAETLNTLSLITFDTEAKSVHWLQIPANLFVHVEETTMAGVFAAAYNKKIVENESAKVEATHAGMNAVKALIEKGFNIPIDYFVSFDPDQLASFVTTLQGISVKLSTPAGGFNAGDATMHAKDVRNFFTNICNQYQANARIEFATGLWKSATKVITSDNLTLYASQLRMQLTTDMPMDGGEDIFFWRRFLQADPTMVQVAHLSTQSIYYNNTSCQVLNRANTLRQINEQMRVYEEDLVDAQFDAEFIFTDDNNPLVRTVYLAKSPFPQVFPMAEKNEEDADPSASN